MTENIRVCRTQMKIDFNFDKYILCFKSKPYSWEHILSVTRNDRYTINYMEIRIKISYCR